MADKKSINQITEHRPYSGLVKTFPLIAFITVIVFFYLWFSSGLKVYLILFICSVLGFFYLSFIAFYLKKIYIKDNDITFIYRLMKPSTLHISESLYQIVIKNGEIRSFRFKGPGILRQQVSPFAYTDGEILLAKIMSVVKRKKIIAQVIEK